MKDLYLHVESKFSQKAAHTVCQRGAVSTFQKQPTVFYFALFGISFVFEKIFVCNFTVIDSHENLIPCNIKRTIIWLPYIHKKMAPFPLP